MNKKIFIEELSKLNINITEEQLNTLENYYSLLKEWNEKINLTSIIQEEEVYLKHFYDSATLNKAIPLENQELCDVGTGAGFPGIVLKILFPELKITLVESLTKRCNFLNLVIDQLKLTNIKVVNNRMEIYSKENPEKFDIITSRAVANIRILLESSIRSIKINGYFLAMKGSNTDEFDNLESCLNKLSSKIVNKEHFYLYNNENERNIYVIKKNSPTSNKYPRSYNEIKKKML